MEQVTVDKLVAKATGENVELIEQRGFVLLTVGPVEREPLVVDWDELEREREVLFPVYVR